MALGKRKGEQQDTMWITRSTIVSGPGSPFYQRLNEIFAETGFDRHVESLCAKFYTTRTGRPGIPPGVYFRMLMIGYLEGIDSERGIAWRCADSLTLREFLGYDLTEPTPDHSSLSRIRQRIDVETHEDVFTWILRQLASRGLITGKTIGIDATTLEANAAMRSIVRRDDGRSYEAYLTDLAKASGIETPTRKDLATVDRKRKNKKTSNDDWMNPHDPDAKITKMKDGRTHLAHKAEHAVDLDTGATLAVTIQPANRGDTTSIGETLCEVMENLSEVAAAHDDVPACPQEVVADRGYHSNDVLRDLTEAEFRCYISEPDRGTRNWKGKDEERDAVYANRRRMRGERAKRLMRSRCEVVERSFAHHYETGGMRRLHLRAHSNILKRALVHSAASNLGLLMRKLVGAGTPRALAALAEAVRDALTAALRAGATMRDGWRLDVGAWIDSVRARCAPATGWVAA